LLTHGKDMDKRIQHRPGHSIHNTVSVNWGVMHQTQD